MASVFTRIVQEEIPAYKVAENADFLAFLDIHPQVPGHTVVIPKKEIDRLWDLPDEMLSNILLFAKPLAVALEKAFECERCAMSVIGLDVRHAHIHLLPITSTADMHGSRPGKEWTKADFEDAQRRIIDALKG